MFFQTDTRLPLPIDPQSLASLASLTGTLQGPEGILTLSQAVGERMAEEAARRTQAATQEATRAGQAYQDASQAPVERPDALAELIPLLTGNIASVVSQNPEFSKRGAEEVQSRREDLKRKRIDNLTALKDSYDKKAVLAAHLQDTETELQARLKSEQLAKTLQVMMQEDQQKFGREQLETQGKQRMAEIAAQGRNALAVAQTNRGLGEFNPEDYIDMHTLPNGESQPYILVDPAKVDLKHRTELTNYGRKNRIPVLNPQMDSARALVKDAKDNIQSVKDTILDKLVSTSGKKKGFRTALEIAGRSAKNTFEAATQLDPVLKAYPAFRTGAIQTIQALASLGKGLRINQAEIQAAQNFDYPTITDTRETAQEKLRILGVMLDHIEGAVFGKPPSTVEVNRVLSDLARLKRAQASAPTNSDPAGLR